MDRACTTETVKLLGSIPGRFKSKTKEINLHEVYLLDVLELKIQYKLPLCMVDK